MWWTSAHTKTAMAGLASLAAAALLLRPPSVLVGVVTVLLVTVCVLVTDKVWEQRAPGR